MRNPDHLRRFVVALSLLLCTGVITVRAQDDGPPPPRNFGDDTFTIGVFTSGGTDAPGLTCDAPTDPSVALTCDGFLASNRDGTLLDVTVRVPQTPGPHPLVVFVHGWGASKNAGRQYDGDLTAAGYTFLRYTTRGFGRSWGQTNFGDINVELVDLRSMIGQVVDDDRWQADPAAVAIMGASYGGAHSWLAAIQPSFKSPGGKDVTIKTVVPIAAGSDLLYSLIPNGRPNDAITPPGSVKLSYLNGLYLSGIREPSLSRPEQNYPNYPPYLIAWHTEINAIEPPYQTPTSQQMVDGVQRYRSMYWQYPFWNRVKANATNGQPQLPIFQIQGFTDDLFPIHESLRMLRALKSVDLNYPIASYFGDIGHPRAANKTGEVRYVLDLVLEWLDTYLKGPGGPLPFDVRVAITRPPDVAFDPADVITLASYDELATSVVTQRFDDAQILTFDPANTSGFVWDPLVLAGAQELAPLSTAPPSDEIPGDVAAYAFPVARIARAAGAVMIAGQPTITFVASTVAHRVQFNVRLFDVAGDGTKRLVTRGTTTLDTGNSAIPLGTTTVTIVTYGNVWSAAVPDKLRLEITNVDSPYLTPSRFPSVTQISDVRLNLPLR